MTVVDAVRWTAICPLHALTPDRGVRALVDGAPVAVFLASSTGEVHALDDIDPMCGASVLSRGLLGSTATGEGAIHFVASPMRKHRFDLRTGACLDAADVAVRRWEARIVDAVVEVAQRSRG